MNIPDPTQITEAAAFLRAGELVAFPTETVYGLGANARQDKALMKIFLAKGRPFSHPLIVHLASVEQLSDWALEIPSPVEHLAKAFWPGPLTIILKKRPEISELLSGGQDSIGLRIPAHPLAQALLRDFGDGIAAPSANRFTHLSPTTAQAVRDELGSKVSSILDGGTCLVGLESTILDLSRGEASILRPGMINRTQLEAVLQKPLSSSAGSGLRAPGMNTLHYAPETNLHLVDSKNLDSFLNSHTQANCKYAILSRHQPKSEISNVSWLMMSDEPQQYARDLYLTLRKLDQGGFQGILVETVPETDEWEAISDRLKKASGRDY